MLRRGNLNQKGPEIISVRPLTREDLNALKIPRPKDVVTRLREPHHALARALAHGMSLAKAARFVGYSYSRAWTLSQDPTFKQCIADHAKEPKAEDEAILDEFASLRVNNIVKAERMIADTLDEAIDNEERLPLKTLLSIVADGADRFGYGKKQTNVNVNVDFAAELEKGIRRSQNLRVVSTQSAPPLAAEGGVPDTRPPLELVAQPAEPLGDKGTGATQPGTAPVLRRRV